ncbi:histidine kinase [Gallaecimonas kandeliae]|uniref:GAF domain-containing protein n=1 Tax=Gallaecimonas kandeliae TaxID=3029055 RepID=UPI002648C553|nr:histidine kinase [Gallaecimonas kandeliae]WKE66269.1 histidine kinase [Gallaecimonas kandeliae]
MNAARYAELSGLSLGAAGLAAAEATAAALDILAPLAPAEPLGHYRYQIPELGEGGACSLFGQLAEEPYDLRPILGGQTDANDALLARLNAAVEAITGQTQVDWLGLYPAKVNPAGEKVLVKFAYRGAPSRPEFPLTPEFAAISNNATVGLSGKGRLIQDVAAYLKEGGEYYTCDPKVQAELCIPLYDEAGNTIGILDAEAFSPHYFDDEKLGVFVGLALWTATQVG